jgi:hypothetical protein
MAGGGPYQKNEEGVVVGRIGLFDSNPEHWVRMTRTGKDILVVGSELTRA